MMAEVWQSKAGFRVSLLTAPITRTRSLEHPIFAAAWGAKALGVETLAPIFSQQAGAIAGNDRLVSNSPAKLLAQRTARQYPYDALSIGISVDHGRRHWVWSAS